MLRFLLTAMIAGLLLGDCGGPVPSGQAVAGISAGPVDVHVAIDEKGQPSIRGSVSAIARYGLGPISVYAGIQGALELSRQQKYHLYILWQDVTGSLTRDEYEVGQSFRVTFDSDESVQEIRGENDSVIVVVKTARKSARPSDACGNAKPTRLWVGGRAYVVYDPPYRNIVRTDAGKSYKEVGRLEPGQEMDIVGGPVCANGMRYWQIESARVDGWTAEGDADDYWLAPK